MITLFAVLAATLAFHTTDATTTSNLVPMLFMPGYGSSHLSAIIDNEESIPSTCDGSGITVNQRISLTANTSLISNFPTCVDALLMIDYDRSTHTFSFPKGITVSTDELGPFSSITQNYRVFANELVSWGYELHRNLFAIPYDYRFMSSKSFEEVGLVSTLKKFIERDYHENGKQKVLIAGHSNGGPTMYSFFTSSQLSKTWKDQYIAGMISLSGNMLGQMNFIHSAVKPTTSALNASWTWEGNYGSLPWGGYPEVADIPIVTSFYQSAQEKNYTAKLSDLQDMFRHVERYDWEDRISGIYEINMMNRTFPPMVDTYCLYGSNLSTTYRFIFNGDIQQADADIILSMEGDDNQDIIDNQFCNVWKDQPQQEKYVFESEAFPNVGHMQMVSDSNVMQKIKEIVMFYSPFSKK